MKDKNFDILIIVCSAKSAIGWMKNVKFVGSLTLFSTNLVA